MGVKFGTEEGTLGPLLRAEFHHHRCDVSSLRGENPQNRPLSKLNNRHFALRAMLPVNHPQTQGCDESLLTRVHVFFFFPAFKHKILIGNKNNKIQAMTSYADLWKGVVRVEPAYPGQLCRSQVTGQSSESHEKNVRV